MAYRTYDEMMAEREAERNRMALSQQLGDEIGAWAANQGWQGGMYPGMLTKNDMGRLSNITPEDLANQYRAHQYVAKASQLPTQAPDYLSQIKQWLGGQVDALNMGGASGQQYDNPYEIALAKLVNNPDAIANTNAYKFRFNQGQQALERSAAAKGMLNSGNTLAALANYGQGLASEEYGNEFNRLSQAVGHRNQYNVGRMNAANQEYQARLAGGSDVAGTALKALIGADDTLYKQRQSALGAAESGGLLNKGNNYKSSW